jgi:hypothetical protein
MATLQQPFFTDTRLGTRAGAIDVDSLGWQVIHTDQVLIERRFKRRPMGVITAETQDNFEPIIAQLMRPHHLSRDAAQRAWSLSHPGLNMDQPVITSRENRTQPHGPHSTEGEALPVAMGWKVGVKQRRQSHPFHLRQQQRNVVDALCDDALYLMHPQSLTQSGISLQICPNGKSVMPINANGLMKT